MPAGVPLEKRSKRAGLFMTLTDCPGESMPALTARDVCQVLRDAIVEWRVIATLVDERH